MTEVASESRQRWTAPFKVFILTHGVWLVVLAEKLNQNIHRDFLAIPGHNTHSEQGSRPVVYKHVLNGETTFSSLVIDAYLLATLATVKGTTQPRFINKTYPWHSNTDVRVSVHFFSIDGIETTRTNGKISSHSSGSLADVGCTSLRPTLQQQSTTTSFGMNEPLASSGCAIVCTAHDLQRDGRSNIMTTSWIFHAMSPSHPVFASDVAPNKDLGESHFSWFVVMIFWLSWELPETLLSEFDDRDVDQENGGP